MTWYRIQDYLFKVDDLVKAYIHEEIHPYDGKKYFYIFLELKHEFLELSFNNKEDRDKEFDSFCEFMKEPTAF